MASKRCYLCRKIKPLCQFNSNRKSADGKEGSCKACRHEQAEAYRVANAARIGERKKSRTARRCQQLFDLKTAAGCAFCGSKETHRLQYHHVFHKEHTICEMVYHSIKRINAELVKCIVVCDSCHCRVHADLLVVSEDMLGTLFIEED